MHEVIEVPFGVPCQTRLWVSQAALRQIARYRKKGDPDGAFWKKLRRFAENGFALYERGDRPPIRAEGGGVYRIGTVDSLFRIIGFYEDDNKTSFIAVDAFLKRGQKLDASERRRIDEVARVRRDHDWQKAPGTSYPRLAT
jgi:hypothetical protein